MAGPMLVTRFEGKSFDSPDEVRTPEKTRIEVVRLGDFTFSRLTFQPGWRWSDCIKPVVKTDSCQVNHADFAVSGRLAVRMQDGTQKMVIAGDAYTVPPGHDAWVVGDEPFVGIEVMSAEQYGKP